MTSVSPPAVMQNMKTRIALFSFVVLLNVNSHSANAGTINWNGQVVLTNGMDAVGYTFNDSEGLTQDPYVISEYRPGEVGDAFGSASMELDIQASYIDNKFAYSLTLDHESYGGSVLSFDTTIQLGETWSLQPKFPGALLPSMDLFGEYFFSARAEYSGSPGGEASGNPYSISVSTGIDLNGDLKFSETSFSDGFSKEINRSIGVRYGIAGQDSGSILLEFTTDLVMPATSIFNVLSNNSFDFVRVVFEDGSTPEEHGFDFTRSSGRTSPNLIVPEPTSLLMASFAGLLFCTRCRRV